MARKIMKHKVGHKKSKKTHIVPEHAMGKSLHKKTGRKRVGKKR